MYKKANGYVGCNPAGNNCNYCNGGIYQTGMLVGGCGLYDEFPSSTYPYICQYGN